MIILLNDTVPNKVRSAFWAWSMTEFVLSISHETTVPEAIPEISTDSPYTSAPAGRLTVYEDKPERSEHKEVEFTVLSCLLLKLSAIPKS